MQNNNDRTSSDYGNQLKSKLGSLAGLLSATLILIIIITAMIAYFGDHTTNYKQNMTIFGFLICSFFVNIFSFTVWGDIKTLVEKIS